jgi:hypothetical protein
LVFEGLSDGVALVADDELMTNRLIQGDMGRHSLTGIPIRQNVDHR